jgi:hypothetical protein
MGGAVKKITANLPAELLERAQRATGLGITETLVASAALLAIDGDFATMRRKGVPLQLVESE